MTKPVNSGLKTFQPKQHLKKSPASSKTPSNTGDRNSSQQTSDNRDDKKSLIGPRRSSGLRLFQGPRETRPSDSRSPSPGQSLQQPNQILGGQTTTNKSSSQIAADTRDQDHTTLPRRMRAPTAPAQYGVQRRSYGGVSTPGSLSSGFGFKSHNRSAPNTPRHSRADLTRDNSPGGSRSSSPVILRNKLTNHSSGLQKPANQMTGLQRPTNRSAENLSSKVQQSTNQMRYHSSANRSSENLMTQDNHSKLSFPSSARPASTSSMMKRSSLSYSETPARPSTSPSSARPSNNSLPTPRSRLPNPPSKSFGFSHNI